MCYEHSFIILCRIMQLKIVLFLVILFARYSLQQCTIGSVRLVSSQCMPLICHVLALFQTSQQYGAVEVCINNMWGSICSDFWDNNDASVICRQLGYSPYGKSSCYWYAVYSFVVILFQGALGPSAVHVSSSTPSHNIIDLNCTGNESSIFECPFNGLIGYYSCSNTRDANVFCQGILVSWSTCYRIDHVVFRFMLL